MIGTNKRGATRGSEDRMHEKKSLSARVDEFLGGKGFYIVLFACIAVIGVSAWLLLFSRFSPLAPDDVGDYVDAMGDLPPQTAPGKPTAPVTTPGSTQPEHTVPEDTKPAVTPPPQSGGALAVQDTTKPTNPPETKPSEPPATDAEVKPEDTPMDAYGTQPHDDGTFDAGFGLRGNFAKYRSVKIKYSPKVGDPITGGYPLPSISGDGDVSFALQINGIPKDTEIEVYLGEQEVTPKKGDNLS